LVFDSVVILLPSDAIAVVRALTDRGRTAA
jgi:hypothetical protein